MGQYWFEIFRQAYDRWSWHFVEFRDGRRRVLARSGRDYGSRKKARKSARRFLAGLHSAQIMPGTGGFRLPASHFAVDYGVVPLMAGVSRRGGKRRRRDRRDRRERVAVVAAAEPAKGRAAAEAGPSEPEQAAKAARAAQQARPRGGGRGRRSSKDT